MHRVRSYTNTHGVQPPEPICRSHSVRLVHRMPIAKQPSSGYTSHRGRAHIFRCTIVMRHLLQSVFMENYPQGTWVWTADHDLDSSSSAQTSVFTGRGILSESAGPVWLIGTSCGSHLGLNDQLLIISLAEHATLYQYNLANAQNHWIGFVQTETVSLVLCTSWSKTNPLYSHTTSPFLLHQGLLAAFLLTLILRFLLAMTWRGPCGCKTHKTSLYLVRRTALPASVTSNVR